MPPKLELVREWLTLAQTDLDAARHLLDRDPPLLESACFHSQQTVEKALKSLLLLNDQRPPRTHNLADLFGLCERWAPRISAYETRTAWLTGCAADIRYPDSRTKVTPELAHEAVTAASDVLSLVVRSVPTEARP
jgi:HEPN domain-containing protein